MTVGHRGSGSAMRPLAPFSLGFYLFRDKTVEWSGVTFSGSPAVRIGPHGLPVSALFTLNRQLTTGPTIGMGTKIQNHSSVPHGALWTAWGEGSLGGCKLGGHLHKPRGENLRGQVCSAHSGRPLVGFSITSKLHSLKPTSTQCLESLTHRWTQQLSL